MNKKRIFTIIILVTILVLLFTKTIFKTEDKTPITEPNKQESLTIETNTVIPEENKQNVSETNINNEAAVIKPQTKPTTQIQPPQTDLKPLKLETTENTINTAQNKQENVSGLIKDIETSDIIVTKEYKPETPYKYSFRDYGVLYKQASK